MDDFKVMQDFTAHVKGVGYVLAGILLLALVAFWSLLTGREKGPSRRT